MNSDLVAETPESDKKPMSSEENMNYSFTPSHGIPTGDTQNPQMQGMHYPMYGMMPNVQPGMHMFMPPYPFPMWGQTPGAPMFPGSTMKEGAAGRKKEEKENKKKKLEDLPSIKYPE